MAQWGTQAESGILRKNKPKENFDELLVFGYACKLFRDDEKAAYIDKGEHLIPWMGDEKLKIDRYDCRGALSDIRPFEASREGFDATRWLGLSESDRKIEQMCDKERFYSLHINEEEEQMYKEEEAKRQKNSNQFQYSYDVPMDPSKAPEEPEQEVETDEKFVAPPHLDIPVDIDIPKTVKENYRIEKTALFVCQQGPQMEILIKAKQSNNPQFGFLNQNHHLYKYYRHVLLAIKNGTHLVTVDPKINDEKTAESGAVPSDGVSEDHYLHPSLVSSAPHQQMDVQTSTIPPIPYKPSANCSYSQLVNRIQGNSQSGTGTGDNHNSPKVEQQMTLEQQQYYQYYYAAQYYEYYKQMAQYQQGTTPTGHNIQPPSDSHLDPNIQTYIQQMAYTQYVQNHTTSSSSSPGNPYAQIVSNLSSNTTKPDPKPPEPPEPVVTLKKPLLSLAQYGSDSDLSSSEPDEPVFKTPSGETRVVIDKMASYVAKNGEQFEEIVKCKGDPRFDFLGASHEYHKYYKSKIREFQGEKKEVKLEAKKESKSVVKEKKVIAPVCFSIKKPKEEQPKEIKSALPVEESDDEEVKVESSEIPKCDVETANESPETHSSPVETDNEPILKNQVKNGSIFDGDDPILEMIDLTDDLEERKDARRAEDKIKDKLAAAAREKLASVARDRALQLERKKKAAAFLKLKSAEGSVIAQEEPRTQTPPRKRSRSRSRSGNKDETVISSGAEDSSNKRHHKKKKSHKKRHSHSRVKSAKKKTKKKRHRSESRSGSSAGSKSS